MVLVDEGYNEEEQQTIPEGLNPVSVSDLRASLDVHALSNSQRSGWSIAFRCTYVPRLNCNPTSPLD